MTTPFPKIDPLYTTSTIAGRTIAGRICLRPAEQAFISDICRAVPGDHVEIGCMYGGSAILAALAKTSGHVYSIDRCSGPLWADTNPLAHPTFDQVFHNIRLFNLRDRITLIRASAHPFPLPINAFSTALIDGAHDFDSAARDWHSISIRTTGYIIVHDVLATRHPGVVQMIDQVAMQDPQWSHVRTVETIAIFQRKS